jgi:hypothetical protein
VLADHGSASGYYPPVRSIKITNQDVEMRAGHGPIAIPGSLEGKPLAMRRRFQRDPARIPLHRRPAEQPSPEGCQAPRISSVQHDLAYPPDHGTAVVAHEPIITVLAGLLEWDLGHPVLPRMVRGWQASRRFLGWFPEAVQFFTGLEADNTKACWSAHKRRPARPRCASPWRRCPMS